MEPVYGLARAILKPWLSTWFRWTIEGEENLPRTGPAIMAFNHIAYLDALAAAYVVDRGKRIPRFLAKSELFHDRKIAWVVKGAGQIEVKRGSHEAPFALKNAFDALRRGECVVIFPEGTITTDSELHPMEGKTGAARLAIGGGVPVTPCALWGTANVWPKGYAKHWRPRQDILARVGRPMDLSDLPDSPDGWRAGTGRIMDEISVLVASLMPAVPDRRRPKRKSAA